MMKPRILVLHATGTNRDREAAWACELAGGDPDIVHVNQLVAGERRLADYQMLILPGGFSYGDDLGAGKLWAVVLRHRLIDDLTAFIARRRPILGICNGFQALVKSGMLPGTNHPASQPSIQPASQPTSQADPIQIAGRQAVTLTRNDSARFECRWVYLEPQPGSPCIFTQGLDEPIYCPVAHGEGKFVARDNATLTGLQAGGFIALRYVGPGGKPAGYPWNPNGSQLDVAGLCNRQGTILGLMPHPEDHIIPQQHPQFLNDEQRFSGLPLFRNGVRYAAGL